MPDSDKPRKITGWRKTSRYYRQRPGMVWWVTLLAIPLLIGLLGWGMHTRARHVEASLPDVHSTVGVPSVSVPPAAEPSMPSIAGLLSILRNGNDFTLTGDLPNLSLKTQLFDKLKSTFGSNINLIDKLDISAGAPVPDLSGLDGLLKAAIDIPDFNWKVADGTLTLTGHAPSDAVKESVEAAARSAWPHANIDNQILVGVQSAEPTVPAPGGAAAGGDCTKLQADIAGILNAPINFETDGSTLTPATGQMLSRVADKIKGCPQARVSVDGYTDNTGNDGINLPLSASRAKAVADYLISRGVPADKITSQGHGAASPVAGNDTAEGMAKNRRVEIKVS